MQRDSAAEALPLLRQALDYVEASDDAEFLLPSLENTAHALYATGQADSAYRTLKVRLMENRAAIEQYETRLTYLHERATWQLRLTLLIVITVVCIAAFICYAFRARRDRERLLNQLHEAENKELNTRLAHERLRSEQYRREVDLRNRELADRVMAINSYNRVLEELRQKIEQEQHEGHLPAQIGIRLQQSIRRHQTHPDEENAFFRIHFEAIYPGFLERLRKAHPDLTEHELRFCAYLRMGMENKTIAHIRSVQPDSIKKLRFRIRKKLAVDPACSLEDFLYSV
ncbi:MAG: hypothetical protein BHV65_12255 [Alistipes sp. 58_9_plus]|nr:MAG: hypothetical protein BHV65_12255 [Alistipes sp. 58_9_plus]